MSLQFKTGYTTYMLAEIIIDQLEVSTIIGIHPHERETKQTLHVSLSLKYDIKQAALHDCIDDALDYDQLSKKITHFLENSSFFLIEACADKLANLILEHSIIEQVSLFLYKPSAIKNAKRVGIKLLKQQNKTPKEALQESPSPSLHWD